MYSRRGYAIIHSVMQIFPRKRMKEGFNEEWGLLLEETGPETLYFAYVFSGEAVIARSFFMQRSMAWRKNNRW